MKNKKNIVTVGVLIAVVLLLGGLIIYKSTNNNENKVMKAEVNQLKLFKEKAQEDVDKEFPKDRDYTNMSLEEAKTIVIEIIMNTLNSVGSGDAVGGYATELINMVNGFSGTATELLNSLRTMLNDMDPLGTVTKLLYTNVEGTPEIQPITVGRESETACNFAGADSKYCVKNLSAKIYLASEASTNWAVVVHPFMTSGSVMYNAVGALYAKAGYNVIAPDLRGFGSSGGSVAMGFLESLDVYDWIRYINKEYTVTNVIVHGTSLGGATTLQLATNSYIPKDWNKTYHVNGFVDDCGYTSMTGIITGMLSMGDISSLTSMLGSMGIDTETFMAGLQKKLTSIGITGLDGLDFTKFTNMETLTKSFSDMYNMVTQNMNPEDIKDIVNQIMPELNLEELFKFGSFGTASDAIIGGYNQGNFGSNWVPPQISQGSSENQENKGIYGSKPWEYWYQNTQTTTNQQQSGEQGNTQNPTDGEGTNNNPITDSVQAGTECYKCLASNSWDYSKCNMCPKLPMQTNSIGNAKVTLINNTMPAMDENFLDGVIASLLMELVGVGLTEENYAQYSDAFAGDRNFPAGSKVLIIHGNADTTVPFSNADTVANEAAAAGVETFRWTANGKPHAFVVIGTERDRYSQIVSDFTSCVNGDRQGCNNITADKYN